MIPALPRPRVAVVFQFGVLLKQPPRCLVGLRPVLAKNAAANVSALREFVELLLDGDPNVPAGSSRSIAVDHLEAGMLLLSCLGDGAVQPPQRLMHRRPIVLEIDRLDNVCG